MDDGESQLVERVRESDREAFRVLFERYQPILFRSVVYVVRDPDTAHDVVQETFVRLWSRRSSLDPHLPVLGLLFRISRNLVIDHVKHEDVKRKLGADVSIFTRPSDENPAESVHLKMLEERIADVIRTKLPPKCREVFLLSRVEEMKNDEISRYLGLSIKTVENQITKGLRILRRYLRGYL